MVPRSSVRVLLGWALCTALGVVYAEPTKLRVFTVEPTIVSTPVPAWSPEQTPADFLDSVGSRLKARWRMLYRSAPPTPSTTRPISAFILGGLMADSFLALQAGDSQQFRNNNQDVLAYCRVLGAAQRMMPRLMAQGKLAETDKWPELRQDVVDGHQEIGRVLREQRDEDLAELVELGLWLRMIEIIDSIVMEANDPRAWPDMIGAPMLLSDLKARFARLTEPTRILERIAPVGDTIDFLGRQWINDREPDIERVTRTHDKISWLMRKLTQRKPEPPVVNP
jgi:hypothetical protein